MSFHFSKVNAWAWNYTELQHTVNLQSTLGKVPDCVPKQRTVYISPQRTRVPIPSWSPQHQLFSNLTLTLHIGLPGILTLLT